MKHFALINLAAAAGFLLSSAADARSIKDLNLPRPLPTFITPVTTFGQRPDWAHDGRRIVFLEKTSGDVYEVDIATRELTPLTHDYPHEGYTRALYLANGDILLSGARTYDATNPGASRNEKNAELWVLRPGSGQPPVPLGAHCREGPATDLPSTSTSPDVGFRMPAISDKRVDFPQPLCPTMATNSPGSIVSETPRRASVSPSIVK